MHHDDLLEIHTRVLLEKEVIEKDKQSSGRSYSMNVCNCRLCASTREITSAPGHVAISDDEFVLYDKLAMEWLAKEIEIAFSQTERIPYDEHDIYQMHQRANNYAFAYLAFRRYLTGMPRVMSAAREKNNRETK